MVNIKPINTKRTIALVIYSDPKIYPPTIHAANILSENGWQVHLIGIKYPSTPDDMFIDPRVKLIYRGQHSKGIKNKISYFSFCLFVKWWTVRHRIRLLIAYDAFAILPVYLSTILNSKKWVYHQHDYSEKGGSLFQRFTFWCEKKLSRKASLVSFPQQQRAEIFAAANKLKRAPLIIFNGPRRSWAEDRQPINSQISDARQRFRFLLVYQGGWSRYFGIENLIKAICLCKTDVAVALIGKELEPGIKGYYSSLASENKVSDRFLFLQHVPYDQLPSITRYCNAGIAKLTNDNSKAPLNDRFVMGASNKVTEYVACSLPVITCISDANRIFFEQYPVGIMYDVENPVEFAVGIDTLLSDQEKMKAMKENNLAIFLNYLNYDNQFSKLHTELEKMIAAP